MLGNVLIIEAESFENAKKIIESDLYYTAGVVSVHDFRAIRDGI